jgi:ABC-type polysaccharide/polyol phosphate transport system ATPase subunit
MTQSDTLRSGVPVLQVRGLGKVYARQTRDIQRKLGSAAWRAFLGIRPKQNKTVQGSQFWAVQNISFELSRGEAIGIIGLNGSGKTTLLRMLAGQIPPDAGEVVIEGSSAAMIDLQAGFQSSASGVENIFLRAAALGFTREETLNRVDEIIEFSELGEAIVAPLSTYSAGMAMRLAFSVMAIVSPDVLLIDEVLAVGDFRFRQKCLSKVREMRDRSAFVFVSHSMGDVSKFCDRVIVMHKGQVYFEGPPDEAIKIYESLDQGTPPSGDNDQKLAATMGPTFLNAEAIEDVSHVWCDRVGNTVEQVSFNQPFGLRIKFRSKIDIRNLIVGIPVWAVNTHYTTGLSTQINSQRFDVRKGDEVDLMLEIDAGFINPGVLKSMLTLLDGPEFLFRQENPALHIHAAPHPTWGAVTVPHSWKRLDKPTRGTPPISLVSKNG